MRVSRHFQMVELLRSREHPELLTTAEQLSPQAMVNLCRLIFLVLQPLRDRFGPIKIASGYRSRALNAAVGGADDSTHCDGRAADPKFVRVSAETVFEELASGRLKIPFDRCAWYKDQDRLHIEVAAANQTPRGLLYVADPTWVRYEGDQGEQE